MMTEKEARWQRLTLKVVLAVTMGVNALNVVSYGLMALPGVREMMKENMDMVPEVLRETYETYLTIGSVYYGCCAFLFAMAFAGALLMWRERWMGFHYYTVAKLLLVAAPLLFLGRRYMNMGDIMMSGLMILYFFIEMRIFGAQGKGKGKAEKEGKEAESEDVADKGDAEEGE